MILLGAWIAIIGYGLMYAGVSKLGGQNCGLRAAFTTAGCQPPASGTLGTAQASGTTQADIQSASTQAQQSTIPGTVLV